MDDGHGGHVQPAGVLAGVLPRSNASAAHSAERAAAALLPSTASGAGQVTFGFDGPPFPSRLTVVLSLSSFFDRCPFLTSL